MYEIGKREVEAVRKVIESSKLFRYERGRDAKETGRFQRALAKKLGVRHALAMTSGTASLICALTGLGIGPGDEVIVPGYTFIASALGVTAVGAVPIIAEVDDSLTIDPADVEAKITRHTKAVMPVHMMGRPCDMDAIMKIARRREVKVVEDACQADGGSYKGRRLGSIGDVGVLSFNFYKIISCGEAGAVVTDDKGVYHRALIQHDGGNPFFMRETVPPEEVFAGLNFRISEIHAAVLNAQLSRLDGILGRLRRRRQALVEELSGAEAFQVSPNNDPEGDCGVGVAIQFPTEDEADAFVRANRRHMGMYRVINTGRHVYSNWEAIMNQRAHHEKMSPWRLAGRKIRYSKDMCPRTLDILKRSVMLLTPLEATVRDVRRAARAMCR